MEDYPIGYPRLSCLLNSDDSFVMFRSFGQLHTRLLLYKQDQLREMEEELDIIDNRDNQHEETQLYLKSREEDDERDPPMGGRSRKELLSSIQVALIEYGNCPMTESSTQWRIADMKKISGQLLKQMDDLRNMRKPVEQDWQSIRHYLRNKQPVLQQDASAFSHKDDLVTTSRKEHPKLNATIESYLRWYPNRLIKVLAAFAALSQQSN